MKRFNARTAVALAGMLAATAWPVASFAQSSSGQGQSSGSSGSSQQQGSSGSGESSQGSQGAYGGGSDQSGQQGSSGAYGGGSDQSGQQGTSSGTGSYGGSSSQGGSSSSQGGSSNQGQSGQGQSGMSHGQSGMGQGAYGGGQQASRLSTSDKDFLKTAAQSNLGERELAQVAEQKASDPAVRNLAQSLASDHEQVSNQLQQFASQHDVTLPSAASKQIDQKRTQLSQLSGRSFDRQFLDTIITQHQQTIKSFEKVADDPNANPQVQMFAIQTLPKLRTHLVEARQAQKQLQQGSQSQGSQGSESGQSQGSQSQGSQGSQSGQGGMQGGGSNY